MYRLSDWLRREWLTLILATLLGGLALNCLLAPHGLRDLLVLSADERELVHQRDLALRESRQLAAEIDNLQNNPAYIEREIRRELGYARANELIYRFGDDAQAP